MKTSVLPLVFVALTVSAAAQARPEEAWRNLQRGGGEQAERNDSRGATPALPEAANPAPVMSAPAATPRMAPAPQGRNNGNSDARNNRGPDNGNARSNNNSNGWRNSGNNAWNTSSWDSYNWNRNNQNRSNQSSNNSGWSRDTWNNDSWGSRDRGYNGRGYSNYQHRDYDRFRLQYFRYDSGRFFGRTRFNLGGYLWPRGYGSSFWLIGDLLPSSFHYDDRYYLSRYNSYNLYAPPLGCRWVRVGDDAVLIDRFDGRVLDVVYDMFW